MEYFSSRIYIKNHNSWIGVLMALAVTMLLSLLFVAIRGFFCIQIVLVWLVIAVRYRGIELFFKTLKIENELKKAGIYHVIDRDENGKTLVYVPRVKIIKNTTGLIVKIKRDLKFFDKLEQLDLTPVFANYLQEAEPVADEKGNYLVYELLAVNGSNRLVWRTLDDLKSVLVDNTIVIDKRLSLPLSHTLIVGQTGSGKSYASFSMILQLMTFADLMFIDPKRSDIFRIGSQVNKNKTASDSSEIMKVMRSFVSNMQKRKQLFSLKYSEIGQTAYDLGMKPSVLIIDEYAALQTRLDRNELKEFNSLMSQVILEGRQLNFWAIVMVQKAGTDVMPTIIREQFMTKIMLKSEKQTAVTTFGTGVNVPSIRLDKGQGFYVSSGITESLRFLEFPTIKFDIQEALNELIIEQVDKSRCQD